MTAIATSPPITTAERCAHCGEACAGTTVRHHDRNFCCQGCASVYLILAEHDLGSFYQIDATAGKSQRDRTPTDYSWLDVEKLARRMVRYRDERSCHVGVELPAIHCASCVWLLEKLPRLLVGVRSCTVDLSRRTAVIVFDPRQTNLRQVAEMLARIGYPPHFKAVGTEAANPPDRSLLYRIGVAGFCFGNMMLLSFPEYLGLGADAGAGSIPQVIGYLLLAFSLPVLGYAGRGFFVTAWYGLRLGRMTIDVPIALGMAVLFLRSAYEILSGTGAGYLDSLAGLVFFLLIGRWFQAYTFRRLDFTRDYRDYFPVAAQLIVPQGEQQAVAAEDLRAGDLILVRPGEIIPADGILVTAAPEGIDYSFVTGEAEPRPATAGQEVFAGGRACTTALRVEVRKPVQDSYLLQLWREKKEQGPVAEVAPPEQLIRWFTLLILLVALVTFGYWYAVEREVAFRAATAVLIIACPCALALAAPFAYGTLQRRFGKRGCYLRAAAGVRELARIDTFIFDKTGTLVAADGRSELVHLGPENERHSSILLAMAEQSAHPRSRDMAAALRAEGVQPADLKLPVREIIGEGLELRVGKSVYRLGGAAFCRIAPAREKGTHASVDGRPVLMLRPAGADLRAGIDSLLRQLSGTGEVYLLSGDEPPTDSRWERVVRTDRIHFRMTPFAKESFVRSRQAAGRRVLMVGDGLNDAGALRAADFGLAVSDREARFSPACDGIMAGERLADLGELLSTTRRLRWVLWGTYAAAFCYNLIGLGFAVSGTLSPVVAAILMPLSSISIVCLATLGGWLVSRR